MPINPKPGARGGRAPRSDGRAGAADGLVWAVGANTAPSRASNPFLGQKKAFSKQERAGEGEAGAGLPGPPARQRESLM